LLIFVSNIGYLATIKILLPLTEAQTHLKLKLSMICFVYITYTLTYAISYPWLTFFVYQAASFKFVLKDFLTDQSRIFNRSMQVIIENPANLEELMRINMDDMMRGNDEAAEELRRERENRENRDNRRENREQREQGRR
jgi:hypothetical protein